MLSNLESVIDQVATQIAIVEKNQLDSFLTSHFKDVEAAVTALKSGEFYLHRIVLSDAEVDPSGDGILSVTPGRTRFVLYKKVAEEEK